MIKDILNSNESMKPNTREIEVLREHFPACFKSDGSFDLERFKEYLNDKVTVKNEGYELKFLGKNYARLLASVDSTTVIVPDEEHNNKPENKNSENIYISGDNLDGLKHLLKSYAGQVKCIYIDPPYNTGSDGFVYNDNFNFTVDELAEKLSIDDEQAQRILDLTKRGSASHSAWLMFMYPRLLLARDLLTDDGVIFISIDDNEQANCRLICDDVFGENNFLTCVSRATGTPTGGGFDGLVNELDYLLVYSRDIAKTVINGLKMKDEDAEIYNEIDSNGNRYLVRSLRRTGGEDRREDRPTMYYPLIAPDGTEIYPIGPSGYESRWICGLDAAKDLLKEGLIEWRKKNLLGNMVWHPYQKYYLDNRTKKPGNVWKDFVYYGESHEFLWDDIEGNKKATRDMRNLFDGEKVFETAKPISYIEKIISIGSTKDSLCVDFFSGSATTAHAIYRMNVTDSSERKFIMIQIQEPTKDTSDALKCGYSTIDQIGMERIKRAAAKLKAEYPDTTADLGFKHFILQETQQETLDKLENFIPEEQGMFIDNDILSDFGVPTVLTTWLVRDGYGFTAPVQKLAFADYNAYYMDKHLYLLDAEISKDAIAAIADKFETDGSFNPENIVIFGYSFTWTALEELKVNLARLKATEKNLHLNFDVRY